MLNIVLKNYKKFEEYIIYGINKQGNKSLFKNFTK